MALALALLFLVRPHELDEPAYRALLPWAEGLGWLAVGGAAALLAALLGPPAWAALAWPGRVLGACVTAAVGLVLLPSAWFEGLALLCSP